jgi:hypothetical protein
VFLLDWIASNWIAAPMLGATAIGILHPLTRHLHPLRRLDTPRTPVLAALAVFAILAAGTYAGVHEIVSHTFEPTEDGLVRGPTVDVLAVAEAITRIVGLQAVAAICLLALVPAAVLGVWRRAPGSSMLARVAPTVAAIAIALPVTVGGVSILWILDAMLASRPYAELAWESWHAVEFARWAIVGAGATALMAATPIVVEAASRGHVIGRRAYTASQVILVVGFGAWTLTRFLAEDVRRGPIATLDDGDVADLWDPAATSVAPENLHTIDLPRGAWCDVNEVDPAREIAVPLALTHSLEGRYGDARFLGVRAWQTRAEQTLTQADGRTPLLVAALDRRVTGEEFRGYLDAAEGLGIERLAILTFTDDHHRTLTLGEIYTRRPCVLVRTTVEQVQSYTTHGVWWGSVSRRITEDAIRADTVPLGLVPRVP